MSQEYDQLLTQARDHMDMNEKVKAALNLAQAGKLLEAEGKPGWAMAVYQIAHELGMNAAPAQHRLSEAGAKLDNDYLRETRRFLAGLDFAQPDVQFIHQVKPAVNMMWHVAEEMLDWMTTFSDEQLATSPWPADGYHRFKELIDVSDKGDGFTPTGWQLWRTHAPVAGIWAFLEATRGREVQSEAVYRTFMTVGGQGARLYRRISMARHFLKGHEADTLVKMVGPSPASQLACFAGMFVWDLLNPEKEKQPDWPTRARSYTGEPAVIVLTGMFSTLLEKFEGMLAIRVEAKQ